MSAGLAFPLSVGNLPEPPTISINLTGQLLENLLIAGDAMEDGCGFSPSDIDKLDALLSNVPIPPYLQAQLIYRLGIVTKHINGDEDTDQAAKVLASLLPALKTLFV